MGMRVRTVALKGEGGEVRGLPDAIGRKFGLEEAGDQLPIPAKHTDLKRSTSGPGPRPIHAHVMAFS